jgi:hypothetical protein
VSIAFVVLEDAALSFVLAGALQAASASIADVARSVFMFCMQNRLNKQEPFFLFEDTVAEPTKLFLPTKAGTKKHGLLKKLSAPFSKAHVLRVFACWFSCPFYCREYSFPTARA